MSIYVLVHGAWHTGDHLEATAARMRAEGHEVHTPTIAGNRPGDNKQIGLNRAVDSLMEYLADHGLTDAVLVGHSYGGMIISGAFDRLPPGVVRRLVYWNAFVPNPGECLNDMVPPSYKNMFDAMSQESGDNSVVLPFAIWREAFMNDADIELARSVYASLNAHPYATFTDRIDLGSPPASWEVGKSYVNFLGDTALPHSLPWHPRLSERLGLFRLVQGPGGHEVCFTDPDLAAKKLLEAGRD